MLLPTCKVNSNSSWLSCLNNVPLRLVSLAGLQKSFHHCLPAVTRVPAKLLSRETKIGLRRVAARDTFTNGSSWCAIV